MLFCCLHPRSCFTNCLFLTLKNPMYMSGKVRTFSRQNGICKRHFFMMRVVYIKLQSDSLCYRQMKWNMQKIRCVKPITYVCNRFNTFFCFKDHKTYQAISCYTLLHQATRGEGKNSSRKRGDFLVSYRDAQTFHFIILP